MKEAVVTASETMQPDRGQARAQACVLLAGSIRPSPLSLETHMPALDLWLGRGGTVLEHWLDTLAAASCDGAPVRVVHDGKHRAPAAPGRSCGLSVSIVSEPRAYRGPAGVLRDVCADLDGDATVLVGDAARWLGAPPTALLAAHASHEALVTVGVNPDGAPAGLYAVRVRALEHVPRNGYIDLKEQWLTRLSSRGTGVWAHRLEGAGTLQIRTREQFLEAARVAGGGDASRAARCVWRRGSAAGAWRVVAAQALVEASASIVESVVMPGVEVAAGAAVVRSILCSESRVEAGEVVNAQVRAGRSRDRMKTHGGATPLGGADQ